MKHKLLLFALLLSSTAEAQNVPPEGGGGYSPPPSACVTPAQQQRITAMLAANVSQLTQQGLLPAVGQRPNTVPLSWPLRQATGFSYNSIYAVINFVDHNASYPNQVLDWNCGSRTYDTAAGYNHAGMDISLWPFDINMMAAKQAEIVAAAPGTIIGKEDGNYDLNCAMSTTSNWNAVYVQNLDGTVCWYGHMKSGTLTSKPVGASVALGEFLGNVGSSGSSTAPHLHFELHSAQGAVLDPYVGTCSTGSTAWVTQKPYYESTINTLLTHSAPPVLNACPQPHTINAESNFQPGARAYFAAYYHDQQLGQATTYTIYRPDNTVFASWLHNSPAGYPASYWYWTYLLPTTGYAGNWRFTATYQGSTITQTFTIGAVLATTASRAAAFSLAPNPAHGSVTLTLPTAPLPGAEALVRNSLGQVVAHQPLTSKQVEIALPINTGIYFVTATTPDGLVTQKLLVE